jgi:hypothetical protein
LAQFVTVGWIDLAVQFLRCALLFGRIVLEQWEADQRAIGEHAGLSANTGESHLRHTCGESRLLQHDHCHIGFLGDHDLGSIHWH